LRETTPEALTVAFLGDGAWGTALACLLAGKGHRCLLWGAFPESVRLARERRENVTFLPGVPLPDGVEPTDHLAHAMASADLLVVSTPVIHLRGVLERAAPHYRRETPAVSVCKGIERDTLKTGSGVVQEVLHPARLALLLGPSHAEEVARGQPTTVVAASEEAAFAERVQSWFMTETFRVYTSTDVVGAELGAALKNVIAIAAGIGDGLGFGDNAKAALVTRGLAEIARLGAALGARRETFAGLTGLGDLFTTCVSPYGRNLRIGRAIGRGRSLDEALAEMGRAVPEGVWTARAALSLAEAHRVDMPITREVCAVLFGSKPPREAVSALMMREPRPEADPDRR